MRRASGKTTPANKRVIVAAGGKGPGGPSIRGRSASQKRLEIQRLGRKEGTHQERWIHTLGGGEKKSCRSNGQTTPERAAGHEPLSERKVQIGVGNGRGKGKRVPLGMGGVDFEKPLTRDVGLEDSRKKVKLCWGSSKGVYRGRGEMKRKGFKIGSPTHVQMS